MISSNPQTKLSFKERTTIYREQRIFKRKQRFFVVLLAWALIIVYIFSPFSKSNIISLNGNFYILNEQSLYEIGFFSPKSFWWNVNITQTEEFLDQYPYIEDAEIRQKLNGVEITLYETLVVGRHGNTCQVFGDDCYFYLSNGREVKGLDNGNIYDHRHIQSVSTIPWLEDEDAYEEDDFSALLTQLGLVQASLLRKIERINLNNSYATFVAVDLTLNAEVWGTAHDVIITVDMNNIEQKITNAHVDILIEEAEQLGRYHLVCVEGTTCIAMN